MELNRKNLTRIIYPVFFCCILLTLLVSRLMYPPDAPEPYSDIWETISGLGNTENNPVGYIFFQIALSLFGILIIPVLIYVHPRLMEIAKNKKTLVVLGSFFLALGSVGFILTGFIPDGTVTIPEFDKFHEITSGMGFLGVMFAAFFYFWPMVRSKQRINKKMLLAITLMWWIPIILAGFAYGYAELIIKEELDLGWYGPEWGEAGVSWFWSFSVWERVLFMVALVYLELLPLSIVRFPAEAEKLDQVVHGTRPESPQV